MADKFRMIRLGMPPELAEEVAGQIDSGGEGEVPISNVIGLQAELDKTDSYLSDDQFPTIAQAFAAAGEMNVFGDYNTGPLTVPAGSHIQGRGTLRRTTTSNLLNGQATGATIEGLRLNMDRTTLGNLPGHGMSLTGNDITVRGVVAYDYGSDGIGGGAGVLIMPASGQPAALRPRLENSHLAADPASAIGIGWIWDTTRFGFAGATLVEGAIGGIGYAHELKNDARYNNLYALTAWNSKVALAYGQQGGIAPSYNMSEGLIAAGCDAAIVSGPGSVGNVYNGVLYDEAGSPGTSPSSNGVMFSGDGSTKQAIFAMASHGSPDIVLRLETPQTYAELASYDASPIIASFRPGAAKSVVDIVHPGARTSIFGTISDTSGNANNGPNANVVSCEGTREYLGSMSGSWTYRLTASGASFLTTHQWRFDNASGVALSGGTDGATNSNFGLVHNIPGISRTGSLTHAIGAGEQYWDFRTNGVDVLRVAQGAVIPRVATATYDLGASAVRFRNLHIVTVDYGSGVIDAAGTGTPEGVLTAGIGSTYRRRDGGTGTSFYVKQSGTGNTGWIAK